MNFAKVKKSTTSSKSNCLSKCNAQKRKKICNEILVFLGFAEKSKKERKKEMKVIAHYTGRERQDDNFNKKD